MKIALIYYVISVASGRNEGLWQVNCVCLRPERLMAATSERIHSSICSQYLVFAIFGMHGV